MFFYLFVKKKKWKCCYSCLSTYIFSIISYIWIVHKEKYGTCSMIVNISKKIIHHCGRHQSYSAPPDPWEWRSAAQNSTRSFQPLTQTAFLKQNWRSLNACSEWIPLRNGIIGMALVHCLPSACRITATFSDFAQDERTSAGRCPLHGMHCYNSSLYEKENFQFPSSLKSCQRYIWREIRISF